MIQKTYILDTNVYGELLIEPNSDRLVKKIKTNKSFFIFGVDIIEQELSETPLHIKHKGEIAQKLLIELFETLSDEIITITPLAKHLAEDYLKKSKELAKKHKISKKYDEKNLIIDFQIIATASLNSVDIVVSSDKRTMLSELSQKVYSLINKINGLRTPELLEYKKFKEVYLK